MANASGVLHALRGPAQNERSSGVLHTIRGGALNERAGGVIHALRGAPLLPGIRTEQIQLLSVDPDKLTNATGALINTANVDLRVLGSTTIYTVPAGKKALILGVVLHVMSASTVTVAPQISVGVNPSTTNIFSTKVLVNFDTVGDMFTLWHNINKYTIANAGEILDLDVVTAATATTLTATIRIIGILI